MRDGPLRPVAVVLHARLGGGHLGVPLRRRRRVEELGGSLMKRTRIGLLAVAALAGTVALGACSSGATSSGGGGGGASPSSGGGGGTVVKIGVDLPLSGGEQPNGG